VVRSPGISGLAVGIATAGGLLLYSGIKNATVSDTLRALLKSQPVPSAPSTLAAAQADVGAALGQAATALAGAGAAAAGGSAGVGSALGQQIVTAASKYLGTPYRFGGHAPGGFDCSGLVTYVLHHDLGISLPNNTHTVVSQFAIWGGAVTVPRNQCQAGDLVLFGLGHMGIAVDNTHMIHAPHTGTVVKQAVIYSPPTPVIRRLKTTGLAPATPTGSAAGRAI
jgi:cell wall-associated NlpC family hydrolase